MLSLCVLCQICVYGSLNNLRIYMQNKNETKMQSVMFCCLLMNNAAEAMPLFLNKKRCFVCADEEPSIYCM